MILPIVKYGDPVLQTEGEEVNNIDGQLAEFVGNMFETMYEAKGVGLAAPQVALYRAELPPGHPYRLAAESGLAQLP